MNNQLDGQWRQQLGRRLQDIKGHVRAANGISSESEMSELELVTEQWLDLVSSFISPLSGGSSPLKNGQLMELVRRVSGGSDVGNILSQLMHKKLKDDET